MIERIKELIDDGRVDEAFSIIDEYVEYLKDKDLYFQLKREYMAGLDGVQKIDWYTRCKAYIDSERPAFEAKAKRDKEVATGKSYILPNYKPAFEHNQALEETVFLRLGHPDIDKLYQEFQLGMNEAIKTENDLKLSVLNYFPSPMGYKLRGLLSPEFTDNQDAARDEADLLAERLTIFNELYTIMLHLVVFVHLSQLWNFIRSGKKLTPSSGANTKTILNFIAQSSPQQPYGLLLRAIKTLLDFNGEKLFFSEVSEPGLLQEESVLNASAFFEELAQWSKEGRINEENISNICLQAEEHLCEFLIHSKGFLHYKLLSVREIHLEKSRISQPKYRHLQASISGANNHQIFIDRELSYQEYQQVEHSSVLLARNEGDFSMYLNLSPFLIDSSHIGGDEQTTLCFYWGETETEFLFKNADDFEKGNFELAKSSKKGAFGGSKLFGGQKEQKNISAQQLRQQRRKDHLMNLLSTFKQDVRKALEKA